MIGKPYIFYVVIGLGLFFGFKKLNEPTPYQFKSVKYFSEMPVAKNNPVTVEGAQLGRFLFYDSILSQNKTFSCASCHQQKFAFSDGPNQFSKGVNGDVLTRNTPPLYNLAWYSAFFWDGRAKTIEEQVFFPVRAHNEMNLDWKIAEKRVQNSKFYKPLFKKAFGNLKIDSVLIAKAIAQFERTLISTNSKYDQVLRGEKYFTKEEYKGFELVNDQTKGGCLHCHTTDGNGLGTTGGFSNNGLDSANTFNAYKDKGVATTTKQQNDVGEFKIPSFRNLLFTAPYMHDGRFLTLKEVLNFYGNGVNKSFNVDSKMTFAHQGGNHLTEEEKQNVLAFLMTLTDSTFINNPEFSNPF